MRATLLAIPLLLATNASSSRPYEDLLKCEELRPKICGMKGAPTCQEVQRNVESCKARIREAEVRRINDEGKKKPNR